MTRDDALKKVEGYLTDYLPIDCVGEIDEIIEALSAEPVLDKIRAEIKSKIVKRPWLDFKDRERDRNDAFLEVLDIIDHYNAESEDKE